MPRLLVVDDDRSVLHLVQNAFESPEYELFTAGNAQQCLDAVPEHRPDAVLLDIVLPEASGLDVFQRLQKIDRRLPVIFITAGTDSDTAIEAMQLGAFDYIPKPLDLPKLAEVVKRAVATRHLMSVPVALPIGEAPADGQLFVGRSPQMMEVFKAIGRVAKQQVTVLIRGESGTGKELVARAIYQHSDRVEHPFMEVNCAAIPENLLESELFGHEKGAFTGAERRRIGKFEQCNGGTIFLDEVGDMSPLVQGKVLRLLQEQRFERVGGNETIQTDVRIIAATNRPLEKMVEDGDFRADLMYRLNGVTIQIPPLRDRGEDIKLLLQHFVTRTTHELNKPDIEGLAPEALEVLRQYRWPGNVRELESVVRQAVLNTTGTVVVHDSLPAELRREPEFGQPDAGGVPRLDLAGFVRQRLAAGSTDLYAETLEQMERFLITRVLQETSGNQSKAAETLGITRGKVRDRIATFNISLDKNVTIEPDDA